MKPRQKSKTLLGVTRSKAKMYEYDVPMEHHIRIERDPARLFSLAIGLLGELAARINDNDADEEYLNELRESLEFSARFFDAYLHSHLNEDLDSYLLLLGSAAYYLCDLPGSSRVLADRIDGKVPDLECLGLEDLLHWLLKGDFSTYFDESTGVYGAQIDRISYQMAHYYYNGSGADSFFEAANNLRKATYADGTPRQLLFSDIICALLRKYYENSSWYCLPVYSGLSIDNWYNALAKDSFIKEFWPAQHLLGKHGIFQGRSAVIQMPTSAGKTKSTEIVIRSAFLSELVSGTTQANYQQY